MAKRYPVQVNIKRYVQTITKSAFYTLAFISENNVAERTITVKNLKEFPDNGYEIGSSAYVATKQALEQKNGMTEITLVAKRPSETYFQALKSSKYNSYYYVATDIEDVITLVDFTKTLINEDITKLVFFGSEIDVTNEIQKLPNVVWWFNQKAWKWDDYFALQWDDYDLVDLFESGYETMEWQWQSQAQLLWDSGEEALSRVVRRKETWGWESGDIEGWDSGGDVYRYYTNDQDYVMYDYDFISWISLCGKQFPTDMNWYNKELSNVDAEYEAPSLANYYGEAFDDLVTSGSGTTCEPMWIDQKVLDDWIRWAIQRNVWKLLKTSNKVSATKSGLEQVNMKIKEVLDFLLKRGSILSYSTVIGSVDRSTRTAKDFTFEYTRVDMINGVVSIEGVVIP